jgi:hypothetical protein
MSDEDKVLERYPNAEANEVEPVLQYGQTTPIQPGYWWISDQLGQGGSEIGRGESEEEAWADAASKLNSP